MFWRKILIIWLAGVSIKSYAAYDADDVVKAYIGTSIRHDTNLYRRANNMVDQAGMPSRNDTIFEMRAGLKIDKTVSLQRLGLDFNVSRPQYAESDQIDYTGWKNGLSWNWVFGRRLSGLLRYQDIKALSAFDDVLAVPDNCPRMEAGGGGDELQYVVDVFRDRRINGDAGWIIGNNVRIGLSLSYIDNRHDQRSCLNQKQTGHVVSLAWVSDSDHEASIYAARTDADFREDLQAGIFIIPASERGYQLRDYGVAGKWRPSPVTELNVRLGRSGLHFAGGEQGPEQTTGNISLIWRYLPKTTLTLGFDRLLESGTDRSGRNLVNDWRLRADWQFSPRTTVYGEGHLIRRDYDSAAFQPDPLLAGRQDRDRTLVTGVNWQPVPAITLSAWANWLRRDVTGEDADYKASIFGMSGQWWF